MYTIYDKYIIPINKSKFLKFNNPVLQTFYNCLDIYGTNSIYRNAKCNLDAILEAISTCNQHLLRQPKSATNCLIL